MRRFLAIAMTFIACGFVANVLMAWVFAALESPASSSMFFIADMRRHYWDDRVELNPSIQRDNLWVSDARQGFGCDLIRVVEDSRLKADGGLERKAIWHVRRSGWPLRSMTGFEVIHGSRRLQWAIAAGEAPKPAPGARPTLAGAGDVPPMLPVKPIWPGFALNWLIVSAMLWVLWLVQLNVRRGLRRWKRRCWSCGYPAGNSDHCSECGAALQARRSLLEITR